MNEYNQKYARIEQRICTNITVCICAYCMYLLICVYVCMYWIFTTNHSACICMYLSAYICLCLYMTESTCITRLNTVQINSFIASTPASRVVRGPNHGPRVDVEQLAARSRRPSLITRAPGIAGVSATGHVAGNRAETPRWDQRQAAEDV